MLSVVLCTYNGVRYLPQQLDSLLRQTRQADEIVIQDDGSTDGTLELCEAFSREHPDIVRFYRNEGEHGPSANFYSAMRKAQGDLLALCDQDDIWEPDKLRLQEEALQKSGALLCGCRSKAFAEDGAQADFDTRRPNVALMRMLHCIEIPGHAILMRRELLEMIPSGLAIFKYRMHDYVINNIAAAADSIVLLDDVLVHYRRHVSAVTYTPTDGQQPTVRNAWHMLTWCLRNYRRIKIKGAQAYLDSRDLLLALPFRTPIVLDAMRLMELQSQPPSVLNYLRTACLCLRHRHEIYHTRGSGLTAIVRALLFPLTSVFYKRMMK